MPIGNNWGKTDLTHCSMFPNSLFNCQKEQVVIFIMRRSHQARSVTSATIDQSQLIVIRFGVLGHDWSISDEPICYDRIDGSDKTPWVWVGSPR